MAKKTSRKVVRKRRSTKPRRANDHDHVHALIHELQVHAEEITVQNEQLLKAQGDLEEARDRFADLYDFAPIGYLTLDHHGVITEINLAGAALLGRTRAFLINLPLSALIVREHRTALQNFLARAREPRQAATTIEVMARTDGKHILRLVARPSIKGREGQLFTAMVDVTDERRLENERRDALEREQTRAAELSTEVNERIAAETRVKALLQRLVTAQEEERRRIARNLHDHLGQQLTALSLTLSSLKDAAAVPTEVRERIDRAEQIVARLDRDVDLLAWDLRPLTLDLGLATAIGDLVRQWTAVTEVAAEVHQSSPAEIKLDAEAEANVYRIVQEALNNVAKHANATHVSVLLEQRADAATVIVEDDGRGFDAELAARSQSHHSGMGLIGMHERAALFDGSVQIESAPGEGTTIFIRIPIKAAKQSTTA